MPLLKNYYGTGGDLNVDEIHEVIPITSDLGVLHPQEGVLVGHFNPTGAEKDQLIKQLQEGVLQLLTDKRYTPSVSRKFTVADMITGYGVSESVRHYYDIYGGSLEGKRVIVQGFGNVGAAAAYYQAQAGAKVVGIIDRVGGIMNPDGFSFEEITELFLNKTGNFLVADNMMSFEEVNNKIWHMGAEVFVPCAASRLLTRRQLDDMINNGLEVIAAGANVPFADPDIFFGPISEYADSKVSVVPDFISNCGMARVFAYLMHANAEMTDEAIFSDTSNVIKKALENAHAVSADKTKIASTAFEIALKQLV